MPPFEQSFNSDISQILRTTRISYEYINIHNQRNKKMKFPKPAVLLVTSLLLLNQPIMANAADGGGESIAFEQFVSFSSWPFICENYQMNRFHSPHMNSYFTATANFSCLTTLKGKFNWKWSCRTQEWHWCHSWADEAPPTMSFVHLCTIPDAIKWPIRGTIPIPDNGTFSRTDSWSKSCALSNAVVGSDICWPLSNAVCCPNSSFVRPTKQCSHLGAVHCAN